MAEQRNTYSIVFNKGLDKASLPFEGDPSRALEELNYVYRDGKVQKRYGTLELLNVKPTHYSKVEFDGTATGGQSVNTTEWNGIFRFKGEDGLYHLIAHIGKLLYEVSETDGGWEAKPITANTTTYSYGGETYVSCYEFESYKSTAFVGANSLYFLGGNQFMRLRYKAGSIRTFLPVEDGPDTYVPTTTISITYEGAVASGRQSYDQANLLSRFRKNLLLGGTGKSDDSTLVPKDFEFTLDSPIVCKDVATDMAAFSMTIRERKIG